MTFRRKDTVIATDVKTEHWYELLGHLQKEGWQISFSYEGHDKAIDYDFYIFKKGREKVIMGWDNWMEGEIKCSDSIMDDLAQRNALSPSFGKPIHLNSIMIGYTQLSQYILRRLGLLRKQVV